MQATTHHGRPRLEGIDRLRGLVLALMVLDHVREYFSAQALVFQPTDLARTTAPLFATRWVTHLCAPTFVLLAGVAAYLQRAGHAHRSEVARFLVTRGLWLIALELTVVSFAFNFAYPFLFFQVIWAIGAGMVLLAPLLWAPPRAVLAFGALLVASHDALAAALGGAASGAWALPWRLLMAPGPAAPFAGLIAYPALPWFGILCLGYGLGPTFARPDHERRRRLAAISGVMLGAFVVLRLFQLGDGAPWATQPTALLTALSFLNVSKYPPSLLYTLVTLGVSLPIGLALERLRGPAARVLLAFGRTPLFTYLVHVYLVHGLALGLGVALGYPAGAFTGFLADATRLRNAGWGFGLPAVYAAWAVVLLLLYPLARAYAALKSRRRAWWMRYV